jgi:hypothetical protein
MRGNHRQRLWLISFVILVAAEAAADSLAETVPHCGGLSARFEFDEDSFGSASPNLTFDQQREFKAAFCAEVNNVTNWFVENQWLPRESPMPLGGLPTGGPYLPRTHLQIFISNAHKISKSIVPAWDAQRGRMLIPTARAGAGQAAIAHELVHIYFPSGNRMLAEGLAVYLQQAIGKNDAFPNFGKDLHEQARLLTCPRDQGGSGIVLNDIDLVAFDRIATPTELSLTAGTLIEDRASPYIVAGSFVRFLIEDLYPSETPASRMKRFRLVYAMVPLVPLERDPGSVARWEAVYSEPLLMLQDKWKEFIARSKCP